LSVIVVKLCAIIPSILFIRSIRPAPSHIHKDINYAYTVIDTKPQIYIHNIESFITLAHTHYVPSSSSTPLGFFCVVSAVGSPSAEVETGRALFVIAAALIHTHTHTHVIHT
jgi:hypothetical protein